jgi:hypothetical protein
VTKVPTIRQCLVRRFSLAGAAIDIKLTALGENLCPQCGHGNHRLRALTISLWDPRRVAVLVYPNHMLNAPKQVGGALRSTNLNLYAMGSTEARNVQTDSCCGESHLGANLTNDTPTLGS